MPTSSQYYADLEIRIQPLSQKGYPVTLVVDQDQQFPGVLDPSILPWTSTASPEEDGQQLFDRLFAHPSLRTAWGAARGKHAKRRVRLVIDEAAPELHAVPWELLREEVPPYPPVTLAAAGDTPFSRYLHGGWEPGRPVQQRPLRMLVAIVNPVDLDEYGSPANRCRPRVAIDPGSGQRRRDAGRTPVSALHPGCPGRQGCRGIPRPAPGVSRGFLAARETSRALPG